MPRLGKINFSGAVSFPLKMLECHKTQMTKFSWVQGQTAIGIICLGCFSRVSPLHSKVGSSDQIMISNLLVSHWITKLKCIKQPDTRKQLEAPWSTKITTCWAQLTENIYLCSPQAHNETISSPFFYFNCLICHSWVPGALHFNVQQRVLVYYQNSVEYLQVK